MNGLTGATQVQASGSSVGPDVSVIIAAYRSRWLADAIGSALAQTHTNLEIVVCADGDDENIGRIVADFRDDRLVFMPSKGNLGACQTHSRAIAAARSNVVGILNDDDFWEPELVETLFPALCDPAVVVSFGNHWIMNEEGQVDNPATLQLERMFRRASLTPGRHCSFHRLALVDLSMPVCCCALFRRDVVNGRLRPTWGSYYDRGIAFQLARTDKCAVFSPTRLARYRIYAGQSMQTRHEENCQSSVSITADILEEARINHWDTTLVRNVKRQHAESQYRLGTVRLRLRSRRSALPSLIRAARLGYPKAFAAIAATPLPLPVLRRVRRLAER